MPAHPTTLRSMTGCLEEALNLLFVLALTPVWHYLAKGMEPLNEIHKTVCGLNVT